MSQWVCDAESDKKEKIKRFLPSQYFVVFDFEVILEKTKINKPQNPLFLSGYTLVNIKKIMIKLW